MRFLLLPSPLQVGLYATGSPHGRIPTPNIDALFESGVRFTSAYAGAPVCAPSRNALLTGQHTGHTWIRGNVPYDGHDLPLRPEDVTLPMVLRASGYRTALVGKWGLGYENSTGAAWLKGWETYFGQLDQSYCHKCAAAGVGRERACGGCRRQPGARVCSGSRRP